MSAQQLVSVMGKKTQVNPMLMKNNMSFVQSLYDTGVAPVQGTVTNKNKDMFQNEERIQSMISNNGNLDYVSKKGFLKFVAIKSDGAPVDPVTGFGTLTIDGEFNTFYTIENTNNPAGGADIELTIKFPSGDDTSVAIPAGAFNSIIVNGVGNVAAPSALVFGGVNIYSDVFN